MDNIFFSVKEKDDEKEKEVFDFNNLLNDFSIVEDVKVSRMIDYNENYTVKELMLICDYYGIAKELKQNKFNKNEIVQFLVMFEENPMNYDIVFKRRNVWFYIDELKKDKFMKKYVIW